MQKIKKNNAKLLSPELQEIVFSKPHWILRNGISIFLVIMLILVVSTFFIRYSQRIAGRGEIISVINKKGTRDYFIEANIPLVKDIQKIKIGQKVLIELKKYAGQQSCTLKGELDSIYNCNIKPSYVVKIVLTNGLFTKQGGVVEFYNGASAQIQIIAEGDKLSTRLIEKLNPFKNCF
ncbi:hypothetical protein [Ferruginibacter sp.]